MDVRTDYGAASAPLDYTKLSRSSILKAWNEERQLRNFYKDPYGDGSERWFLPEFALDCLRLFKPETGKNVPKEWSKRKDGITENILHELDPLLMMKGLFQAGYLPPKVTRQIQIADGRRSGVDEAMQSIELLFAEETIHDLDEDFPHASKESILNYLRECISTCAEIKDADKQRYYAMLEPLGRGLDAITLGRKIFAPDGRTVITEKTHQEDPHLCFNALEELWFGVGAKGLDKLGGTITRFSLAPTKFTIEGHINYCNDIRRLFMSRQTLELSAKQFPQMAEFFEIVNANLKVAYMCMDAIVQNHPDNPRKPKQEFFRPETARIDLCLLLPTVFKGAEFYKDVLPLREMLVRLDSERSRHPSLNNLVEQMHYQIGPYLERLGRPIRRSSRPVIEGVPR